MKIVNILGGLGNQMFQYAFALKIKRQIPDEEVRIYTKGFKRYPLHNGYELDKIFNLELPEASLKEVAKAYWPIFDYNTYRLFRHYFPARRSFRDSYFHQASIEDIPKYTFFDGYFQRAEIYEDTESELQECFRFPEIVEENNAKALKFISEGITASVHVRRGDYLLIDAYQGICTPDYYRNAIAILKKKYGVSHLMFFSNDIEWVKETFADEIGQSDALFIDWNSGAESYRDMQLMSLCHHNIIANSSFSWWGAFLNSHKDKVVIAPSQWANNYHDAPIIPNSWTKI